MNEMTECDIHLHIEVLVDGEWEHYAAPWVNRWYRLFGLLARVHDKRVIPVSEPKGFPDDVSNVTRIMYASSGKAAHTASWLSHDEIMEVEDELQKWANEPEVRQHERSDYMLEYGILRTYLAGFGFTDHWRSGLPFLPEGIDDVRFVFWFESKDS